MLSCGQRSEFVTAGGRRGETIICGTSVPLLSRAVRDRVRASTDAVDVGTSDPDARDGDGRWRGDGAGCARFGAKVLEGGGERDGGRVLMGVSHIDWGLGYWC